ncbi:MAG TPA: universal stress protein [Candidatus Methylomirabilis sp.]|nr:universal stress protein [Candidatus Methylomirabilis sp.]
MVETETRTRIALKNVLYLTDFSESAEAALPLAVGIAREYSAKVYALHVILPDVYGNMSPEMSVSLAEAQEEAAKTQMQRVESALRGVSQETIMTYGSTVWPTVDAAIRQHEIDLVILGTRGRTGASKLLLGSVAEEILRRASVPVLTIGPGVRPNGGNFGRFDRVLFATDFTPESMAAAPYAISFAEEGQARLILLYVIGEKGPKTSQSISVAEALHQLYEIVPQKAREWCRPEMVVEHGEPAPCILEAAGQRLADLVVLGVRNTSHILAATHLEGSTVHKIVAQARCPVLTVPNPIS